MDSKKLNKHDTYVEKLVNEIKDEYDSISTHLKFSNTKRIVAEADVVARKGDEIHIYEVKCSLRIVKAKKQLKRLKKIISPNKKTSCFLYNGMGDTLLQVY